MTSYSDLILRWRHSAKVLLTCDDTVLTYSECVMRGDELARAFLGLGLERPARVALVLPNSAEFVISLYACARIGITAVPISTWSKPSELRRILRDARVDLVLARDAFPGHAIAESLQAACADDPSLDALQVYEWSRGQGAASPVSELLSHGSRCDDRRWSIESGTSAHTDADLVVLYTSGSTGAPKGVILPQSSVALNGVAIAGRMGFGGNDRIFSYFPLFFSGGLCNALTGAISCGAELVTQSRFDPAGALSLIRSRRCTGRNVWHDGLEPVAAVEGFRPGDFSRMRRGLHVDPELYRRLSLAVDEGINMYGMTETATAFTCGDWREPADVRQSTHGKPFDGSDLRICNPDETSPLGVGVEGEICVRGYNLMRGYTDGSHVERIDDDGFFHTGDIGFVDPAGYLHFVGRRKTLIKVKGLTVQPEEVEATLLRHPAISKAVVVGEGGGHESKGVVALIVLHEGDRWDMQALRTYCQEELSSYKVPRLLVVDANRFPLSASLKIDRIGAATLLKQIAAEVGCGDADSTEQN
ncbi:AMP-binding enzyme family protein [Paraburkholderia xenovorans LB400]|uniref:class I adenylate-forming enzyme family protein n=1 Tax=Paraburkholderia xenovorans TaxID=36873 RepID=UPI0004F61216|nr:class I adenylate-forming enzyme family protein [Paraburkholderia xenovorans]AIP34228.1 AMP-binding enzyme family protein [Paraburkholderia xenovorans LB400]